MTSNNENSRGNDNPPYKHWIIGKIKLINWVTITTFFICLLWEIIASTFGADNGFKVSDLSTWRPRHIIIAITGTFLIIENIALLKRKRINIVEIAKELKEIDKKEGSNG